MRGRVLAGLALVATGVATGLASGTMAVAQGSASPQERWAQVVACARQGEAASRHECIDAVLRVAGVLDPAMEAAALRQNFGRSPRPVEPAPPSAAVEAAAIAANPAVAGTPPPVASVASIVTAARFGNDRRLLVATQGGAVWRQVDDEDIRTAPRPGTPFEVREAALGSYRCTVGRSTHFRCARAD
jgi:hypothetical protein